MNSRTAEWVNKAEQNYGAASILLAHGALYDDLVCNQAQQCGEKYMKAYLEEQNQTIQRTHDLVVLLSEAIKLDPSFATIAVPLAIINRFAVDIRYPGDYAQAGEAQQSFQQVTTIRTFLRSLLGI